MRFLLILILAALVPGLVHAGERKEKKTVPPIAVVQVHPKAPLAYEKDIEPILKSKCQSCHNPTMKEGGLDMSTYDLLMKGGKKGKPILPGKSAESRLVHLAGRTAKPFMPPKDEEPLNPEELALIKLWIDQGAPPPSGMRERPAVVLGLLPAGIHPVRALALSPDNTLLAVGRANQVYLFDVRSGTLLRTLVNPKLTTGENKPVQAAHLAIVDSLAFSPDGKVLASGAFQEVNLWETATGTFRHQITGFADRVVALAFSPDGKWLATGGGAPTEDGEIKLFEVPSGKPAADIKNGHSDQVFGVCFSPDGTKLATCGADKFVKVFEVPSGKLLKTFEGHTHHVLDVGWKADGKLLASASADNSIKIWDYDKGEQVRSITGHTSQITRLLFIGKTPQIVTCSGDQTVR
ncbi:MAG: NB-ARC domain protein, partial [Planctomycetes bacterium]|nr:NB-ARC domain protein [Planctomycetota bacterium]